MLPALSVRRGELRRSLRIATVSWLFGSAWAVLVSGVQLKSFARMLGFNDDDFGILTAIPAATNLGMLLAAEIIERSGLRKYQFLHCGIIHRLLWLVVAAIPSFLLLPSRLAVWAMLGTYTLSWIMNSMANPAWTTWMSDLVPRRIRGRFFAARFGFGRIIQVILVVAIGALLDYVTVQGQPETAAAQPAVLRVICIIFAIAGIVGAAEIWMYRSVREIVAKPKPLAEERIKLFSEGTWIRVAAMASLSATCYVIGFHALEGQAAMTMKIAFFVTLLAATAVLVSRLREPMLRRYVAYGITIGFAVSVPGFFFWVYTTEYLGFSKLAAQVVFMVISPILGMIGLSVWGRMLDRWGRRPVLMAATFMTVFSVLPYFFSSPHTPCPAFIAAAANWVSAHVGPWFGKPGWVWITPDMPAGAYLLVCCSVTIGGIGWTGVMMGQGNMLLSFTETQGRSRYVAATQVLMSIGTIIGGPVGGYVVSEINRDGFAMWHVGPFVWTAYHATFALSCLGRFASLLWLIGMPDPGSGKVKDMLRYIGVSAFSYMSNLFLYPFRTHGDAGKRVDSPQGHKDTKK